MGSEPTGIVRNTDNVHLTSMFYFENHKKATERQSRW